ncbi:hypothetical protein LTR49_028266 [Elasticomyces elasticus]|nr:hypothetical protein LTR49_028266 [Elasticomyces elasticus]
MASVRGSEVDSPSASIYESVKEISSSETAAEVKRQLGLDSSKNDLYVWSMLVILSKLRDVMVEEVLEQHWSKLDSKSSRAYDGAEWTIQKAHERRKNKDRMERKKATTSAEAEASARDDATPVLGPGVVAEAEYTTPAASARDDATPEMDSDMVADAEDTAPAADHVPWRYDPIRDL